MDKAVFSTVFCFVAMRLFGYTGNSHCTDPFSLITANVSLGGSPFAFMNSNISLPPSHNGQPLPVFTGIYVESFGNIRASTMSFDVDMYVHLSWRDSRQSGSRRVVNDMKSLDGYFLPDIYFANARTATFQNVLVPNFVLRVDADGTAALSSRVTLNVACSLNLVDYPLDNQICTIKILSYAHTKAEMAVQWFAGKAISTNGDIDLPEFYLTKTDAAYCDGTFDYAFTSVGHKQGEFSCLIAKFYLRRSVSYHLVQTFLPTGLIVVVSWVSFWIDRTAVPARISLSFTTLLTLTTMGAGLRHALPPVSYAKAIDYWYGTCMVFVLGALLEFALVNSLMRRAHKCESMADGRPAAVKRGGRFARAISIEAELDLAKSPGDALVDLCIDYSRKALRVDHACRLVFPSAFFCFVVFYWIFYYCRLVQILPE